ncbi:CTLH/CRA C-terminal to lish motif domain-domain-containing protein [Coniella lustricola]|uniref:GID complex catalytic subunit 2 n=1 Tax=Coniella lustricola TaxID=2025994 RepID=A0A2T3AFH1_9PEZI|nr:CTLH/CRA C-terminal to lish motif domain-domain-containing protein [Coniella lustricola]
MDTDIPGLLSELDRLANGTTERLSAAVEDVDKIIEILTQAREQVAQASDPHTASIALTKLQNPVKDGFDAINEDLRKVDKVRKESVKVLNRTFPARALPTDDNAMTKNTELINRAITWHLLREGQFSVASTFIKEAQQGEEIHEPGAAHQQRESALETSMHRKSDRAVAPNDDTDMDAELTEVDQDGDDTIPDLRSTQTAAYVPYTHGAMDAAIPLLESHQLQEKFANMYSILSELKNHNLLPAIRWANQNSQDLELRGSDLEFELCKRQYIYLIQQQLQNGHRDGNGLPAAMHYAQSNFPRFADRHAKEIAQLASALVFISNLEDSPYSSLFTAAVPQSDTGFEDIAASFTREFCSLLGLSAESPLYVAVTAGAISLPRLMKYVEQMTVARASWTTASELAFETPLPRSMLYHSIFVCPVSKEQTTDENPPMMLPCGHVLAKESLKNLVRSHQRLKCPYCPVEGQVRDAKQLIL